MEKQHAYGLDVTSHSKGTPRMTSFLSIAYLEYNAIRWEECHDRILGPILIRDGTFHLAISAGEVRGRTDIIQDKIAI
jgi:hypothetical protein